MLTFLRKIRKSFVDSGHLRNYVAYAIGEIFLVMIGILLALQMNTWNQQRIEKKQENQLVKALYDELAANSEYLKSLADFLEKNIERSCIRLLRSTAPDPSSLSSDSLLIYFRRTQLTPPFAPLTAVFDQIINTDDLNLISKDSFKYKMNLYKSELASALVDYQSITEFGRKELTDYSIKNLVMVDMFLDPETNRYFKGSDEIRKSEFSIDADAILSDRIFENMIITNLSKYHRVQGRIEKIQHEIVAIRKMIERNYQLST